MEPNQGQVRTGQEVEPKKFPKEIAFNCIPYFGAFMEDGYTSEEWKMVAETKKILDPKIKVTATCVRVPVFVGHSEAVNIEFERPITADEARDILREAPGCLVIDKREPGGYITPMEAAGEDATYISRIREDATVENGLAMWVVSDNLRKGAALNAVQIAELLINRKLLRRRRRDAARHRGQAEGVRPLAQLSEFIVELGARGLTPASRDYDFWPAEQLLQRVDDGQQIVDELIALLGGSASRMRSSTRLASGSATRSSRRPSSVSFTA